MKQITELDVALSSSECVDQYLNTHTHTYIYTYIYNLQCIRAGVGNKLFQLSAKLDFEVTEALENRILDYLRHFYTSPLYRFSIIIILCIKLYCILSNKIYLHYIVLQISVTQQIKMDSVTKVLKRNHTSTVRLVACRHAAVISSGVQVQQFPDKNFKQYLVSCSPAVKHTRVYKEVISSTHSNVT